MSRDRRLYARFDINMDDHPKIMGLSDAAFRAVFESTFHARRHLTDGFLDARVVARKWGAEVAAELTSNDDDKPTWVKVDGGYMIHDFGEHQVTSADIQAKRDAGRKGGIAKAQRASSTVVAPATESLKQESSITLAKTETETETNKRVSSEVANATPRRDVDELLDLLETQLTANGSRIPARTKKNADAARLLLDRDGYTVEQVAWMIRWATGHEFWRGNILSMSKLREKFDQLKAQAGVGAKAASVGFGGEIDVDAVLGKDHWVPGAPPEGLDIAGEIEWKREQRAAHQAARLAEARAKVAAA